MRQTKNFIVACCSIAGLLALSRPEHSASVEKKFLRLFAALLLAFPIHAIFTCHCVPLLCAQYWKGKHEDIFI